jgi:hypothetical protein
MEKKMNCLTLPESREWPKYVTKFGICVGYVKRVCCYKFAVTLSRGYGRVTKCKCVRLVEDV